MGTNILPPGGIISLTAAAADRLMKSGNGDATLLYLHLLRRGGEYVPDGARHALGWTADRVGTAYTALGDLGLVDKSIAPTPSSAPLEPAGPPEYSAADITPELEGGSPFSHLVKLMEGQLGKVMSMSDLKMLYTIYDFLALPPEVILTLTTWCAEETRRKYGEGQKPRMSQIKKEAFIWKRLGVDTLEAADAHTHALADLRNRERSILPILGIAGRLPVEAERKYISAWVDMGFDDETLGLAYEKTILKKGSLNWAYMNSILRSWHQKNLHTVAQVESGDSAYRRAAYPTGPAQPQPSAPSTQAKPQLKEAMDWMDRFLAETDPKKEGT